MRRVALLSLLVLMAAAPTTAPAPSADAYPALQKRLREVLAENVTLKQQIAQLQERLSSANEQLKKATASVREARPSTQTANVTPFGVGWEGPIGKARIEKRVSEKAAVLSLRDANGKYLGEVYVSNLNVADFADGMEFESTQQIRIDRVMQEIPAAGIYRSILFARIPD